VNTIKSILWCIWIVLLVVLAYSVPHGFYRAMMVFQVDEEFARSTCFTMGAVFGFLIVIHLVGRSNNVRIR
jgi:ABC-type Mn2+/Zn2+ transport system permease subunit